MNAIQRFFFNIFLFCFGFGLLFFVSLSSYASTRIKTIIIDSSFGAPESLTTYVTSFDVPENARVALLLDNEHYNSQYDFYYYQPIIYLNIGSDIVVRDVVYRPNVSGSDNYTTTVTPSRDSVNSQVYRFNPPYMGNRDFSTSIPIFYDYNECFDYIENGTLPLLPFDETLELDYFKVSPYGMWDYLVSTPQDSLAFDYKYDIGWSDSRISKVQLKIDSTRSTKSFVSSFSPFKGGFKGSTYAQLDGDVVRLIATPYKADGSYGVSLYYSFTQKNNAPLTNLWRKLFKNDHTDNTLTIPYENTNVTQPVEGVGTVNNYKVNYNPVTNEYGDLNLYEIYYQPVVVYQPDTPQEEIDSTQDVVNNTYVTNNYYETTKNINLGFDINFGDISTNDITDTFDNFGNFGNGFGSFINRLASWLQLLFPFLHPSVAAAIVFVFGLIVSLAIIALVLKIAGVIADIIPL